MKAYKVIFLTVMNLLICLFMAGCSKPCMKTNSSGTVRQETIGAPGLDVRGIVYSENHRYAIIGTKTMQEGDEINGAIIIAINRDNVVFEKNGNRWTQRVDDGKK